MSPDERKSWHEEDLDGAAPATPFRLRETKRLDEYGNPDESLDLADRDHVSVGKSKRIPHEPDAAQFRAVIEGWMAQEGHKLSDVLEPSRGRPTEARKAQLAALAQIVYHLYTNLPHHKTRLKEIGEALGGPWAHHQMIRRLVEKGQELAPVQAPEPKQHDAPAEPHCRKHTRFLRDCPACKRALEVACEEAREQDGRDAAWKLYAATQYAEKPVEGDDFWRNDFDPTEDYSADDPFGEESAGQWEEGE